MASTSALLGRETGNTRCTLAEKRSAIFFQFIAERIHDADQFDASLPGKKLPDVFVNDEFRAGDFAFAGAAVLLNDLRQVVDVVEIKIVKVSCGGFDISW